MPTIFEAGTKLKINSIWAVQIREKHALSNKELYAENMSAFLPKQMLLLNKADKIH